MIIVFINNVIILRSRKISRHFFEKKNSAKFFPQGFSSKERKGGHNTGQNVSQGKGKGKDQSSKDRRQQKDARKGSRAASKESLRGIPKSLITEVIRNNKY